MASVWGPSGSLLGPTSAQHDQFALAWAPAASKTARLKPKLMANGILTYRHRDVLISLTNCKLGLQDKDFNRNLGLSLLWQRIPALQGAATSSFHVQLPTMRQPQGNSRKSSSRLSRMGRREGKRCLDLELRLFLLGPSKHGDEKNRS